ncbi:type III secretion system inner rod subunit SctI [uncultured Stenotrophomonas sp.]|uniref:type III secretion system inner rod subunit SctI n=1 Tax=uncultured Stenotrophomonas sp. TaxID=165438 RepID=UPI0028E67DA5|nr:type III secretion system inner rod subunit SctI [uncultured Stenotrophomonas sp.]
MQVTPIATELNVGGDAAGGTMTLSDRMSHALANSYVNAGQDLGRIQAASNNADTATSPAALIELQLNLADYTKRMIVAAGLANHANKTVETLLKS